MIRTKQIREGVTALNFSKVEHQLKKQKVSPQDAEELLEIVKQR